MPAALVVGGLAAAGGVASAVISSNASKSAANTAAQTAADNNALQASIYQQNSAHAQPFYNSGLNAQNNLNDLLNGNSAAFDKFRNSTNYQFQLGQGMDAVNNNLATHGALNSGAALKAINNYAQGQAGNALGSYIGALQNQQGVGLSASNALSGVGTNYANSVSSNNNNAASAAGNAAIASGNAWNGALNNTANALGGMFNSSYGSGVNVTGLNNMVTSNEANLQNQFGGLSKSLGY